MKRIITINREFGSGGYRIGLNLAERLGITFYDKKLVQRVAEETGFSHDYIEKNSEQSQDGGRLRFTFSVLGGAHANATNEDLLWAKQAEIIRSIAEQEPCVIMGRAADYILHERADVLNVFVHAPIESRIQRITSDPLYDSDSDIPAEQRLRDKDRRRARNYKERTGHDFQQAKNYHICMDSSMLGIDRCVELIEWLYKKD